MEAMTRALAEQVGSTMWSLLQPELRQDARERVFYVAPLEGRLLVAVNPLAVKNIDRLLNGRFAHHLSTALGGRKVKTTNTRGIFFQVGLEAQAQGELEAVGLDLSKQPDPLSVPIGMTRRGPMWVSLPEMDAVLIGGARRMGKTRLVHGWIMALVAGGKAQIYLWDGKQGQEFGRYTRFLSVMYSDTLVELLNALQAEAERRSELFRTLGVTSLAEYNERTGKAPLRLPILALFVDEAAFIPQEAQGSLHDLIARCGAYGIHPVLATQRPSAEAVQTIIKANLSTRISFAVPTHWDSSVILGRPGAENLAKKPGRLLLAWKARLVQAQAFLAEPPRMLAENEDDLGKTEGMLLDLAAASEVVTISQGVGAGLTEWEARQGLKALEDMGLVERSASRTARRLTTKGLELATQRSLSSQSSQSPTDDKAH